MKKTYSQKVAGVFESIGYVLLFPASFGVLSSLGSLFIGLLAGSAGLALYGLLNLIVIGIGIYLLVGYHKHAAGRLAGERILNLWKATAVFNFVLLLPFLYWAAIILQGGDGFRGHDGRLDGGEIVGFLILLGIISGYLSAIVFSMKAFSFERRKKII